MYVMYSDKSSSSTEICKCLFFDHQFLCQRSSARSSMRFTEESKIRDKPLDASPLHMRCQGPRFNLLSIVVKCLCRISSISLQSFLTSKIRVVGENRKEWPLLIPQGGILRSQELRCSWSPMGRWYHLRSKRGHAPPIVCRLCPNPLTS